MSDYGTLLERVRCAHQLASAASARSLQAYLDSVVIDTSPRPQLYRVVREPWQVALDEMMVPPFEALAGLREPWPGTPNFWLGMPRGHDKTSRLGRYLNWLLAYSRRPLSILAAARDADQIALLTEAMQREAMLNPWLRERLIFARQTVRGRGGVLKAQTSDAPSAFGHTPDLVICDELTHWKSEDLWSGLWSGREKRAGCLVFVLTNAGVLDSWQDRVRKAAKADPSYWTVYEVPEYTHLAGWMDKARVDKMRAALLPSEAKRVLDNVWIDAAEESGYLTRADVQACEDLGRALGLIRQEKGNPAFTYYAGVDYGPKKDRTALSVLHYDPGRRLVVVDRLDVWQRQPSETEIPVARVEEWMIEVGQAFNPTFVVDPYQMLGTIQRFEHHYPVERFEARGGKRNYEMAEGLRNLIVNRQIAWYAGAGSLPVQGGMEGLVQELAGLVTEQMSYGYRFDHESGRHDDRAVAVGMPALYAARELAAGWVAPEQVKEPEKESPSPFLPEYVLRERGGGGGRGLFGL